MQSNNNKTRDLTEFLNKKKVPGILEYLESKIHERGVTDSASFSLNNSLNLTREIID